MSEPLSPERREKIVEARMRFGRHAPVPLVNAIDDLLAEVDRLKQELGKVLHNRDIERRFRDKSAEENAELKAERDQWKSQYDRLLLQACKDFDRAHMADTYEQWLLDLGRISGCGHVDERLPRCIREEFEKLTSELAEAQRELADRGSCESELWHTAKQRDTALADAAATREALDTAIHAVHTLAEFAQPCPAKMIAALHDVVQPAKNGTSSAALLAELERLRKEKQTQRELET